MMMHIVKLLAALLVVSSSVCLAQVCNTNGISCYPADCCSQYRQCVGDFFYPVQQTAPGTVCKNGLLVFASECSTPCPSAASATATVTKAPTTAPAAAKPTTAPPASATQKPISVATPLPTSQPTKAPTQAPTTVPTPLPTAAPTKAPTPLPTQAPTPLPTAAPTKAPTQAPTQKATITPTNAPTQSSSSSTGTVCTTSTLASIFSQADFNALFPHANGGAINNVANQHAIFNYSYLISAAQKFPQFACNGDRATRLREVAAFLAQTSQETSGWWSGQPYNWGFYFSTEVGCTNTGCTMYCDASNSQYPCAAGKGYYGRGPIQLSWNYNYGQVSQALFGSNVLLTNPDKMFDGGDTAFQTALWFWMTPQSPKPSCHDVMTGVWSPTASDLSAGRKPGFGTVTNIINGGIECGHTTPQNVLNRVGYYNVYTAYFGVSAGDNLFCDTQRSY